MAIEEAGETVDKGMSIHYNANYVMKKKQLESLSIYEKLFLPGEKIMNDFAKALRASSPKYYEDFSDIHDHVLKYLKDYTQEDPLTYAKQESLQLHLSMSLLILNFSTLPIIPFRIFLPAGIA